MSNIPKSARILIGAVASCAAAVLGYAAVQWHTSDAARFLVFLGMSVVASRLKVKIPRLTGSMSFNLPFLLIGITELSFSELIVVALVSTTVQCLPTQGSAQRRVQLLFNVCTITTAITIAHYVFSLRPQADISLRILLLLAAAAAYFFFNTTPVAMIIALTEHRNAWHVWSQVSLWSFAYFLLGATMACTVLPLGRYAGWQAPLIVMPLMFAVYHSYRMYCGEEGAKAAATAVRHAAEGRESSVQTTSR
jgi:hypothetical protein